MSLCGSIPVEQCAPLVGGLDLLWAEVTCLQDAGGHHCGRERGWSRLRGGISSLLPGCHCLIRGGVRSQAGGAEALRIGSKLTLFPLNTCSPLCQHWHPCHRGEQCWSKRGPCRLQACDQSGATAGQPRTQVASDVLPVPASSERQPLLYLSLLVHRSSQPPLPPVCGGVILQGSWGPGGSWSILGMGCGGLAAIRDQDHPDALPV